MRRRLLRGAAGLLCCVSGCAAVVVAAALDSVHASELEQLQRLETQALRFNAGLALAQYRAELEKYDPTYFRRLRRHEIEAEMRRRRIGRRSNAGYTLSDYPPDLRKEYKAITKKHSVWTRPFLLYRAQRLAGGASEEQVLRELQQVDPRWHKKLVESGWK